MFWEEHIDVSSLVFLSSMETVANNASKFSKTTGAHVVTSQVYRVTFVDIGNSSLTLARVTQPTNTFDLRIHVFASRCRVEHSLVGLYVYLCTLT